MVSVSWPGLSHTCVSVSSSAPPPELSTRQLQLRAAVYCSVPSSPSVKVPAGQLRRTSPSHGSLVKVKSTEGPAAAVSGSPLSTTRSGTTREGGDGGGCCGGAEGNGGEGGVALDGLNGGDAGGSGGAVGGSGGGGGEK